jgi:hypothetical protein
MGVLRIVFVGSEGTVYEAGVVMGLHAALLLKSLLLLLHF